MLHGADSEMPMLTTHPPAYHPETNTLSDDDPSIICGKYFTQMGTIRYRSQVMKNWQNLTKPLRARFIGGGFYFTLGRHCIDYQYDPEMYFEEEEISLVVRSFTMGYDFFHPHRSVVWHHYTTDRSSYHYKDHSDEAFAKGIVESSWKDRQKLGAMRIKQLLGVKDYGIDLGIYSLGNKRTISDYEQFAGVKFREQLLHIDAIKGMEPPCQIRNNEKGFFRIRTFNLDYKISDSNAQSFSKQTTKIWIILADFEQNIVWFKKLNQREIRSVANNQRIKTRVTLTPKKRIASWLILTKNECKWDKPIFIAVN